MTDFLIKIFEQTKNYLAREESYAKDCPVELVITLPTIWSQEASRILQFCVEAVIQATEFGSLKNESVDNLFHHRNVCSSQPYVSREQRRLCSGLAQARLSSGSASIQVCSGLLTLFHTIRRSQDPSH
jgi:hypothetical protein